MPSDQRQGFVSAWVSSSVLSPDEPSMHAHATPFSAAILCSRALIAPPTQLRWGPSRSSRHIGSHQLLKNTRVSVVCPAHVHPDRQTRRAECDSPPHLPTPDPKPPSPATVHGPRTESAIAIVGSPSRNDLQHPQSAPCRYTALHTPMADRCPAKQRRPRRNGDKLALLASPRVRCIPLCRQRYLNPPRDY